MEAWSYVVEHRKVNIKESNLHYIHYVGITPQHLTNGGVHFRGLAPGQHSSEETSQRWRAIGDTVTDLTGLGFEPTPTAPIAMF